MSLNVKNPRAHQLASEIADLTGDSITSVVIQALEARLNEVKLKKPGRPKADRMLGFAAKFAEHMDRSVTSADHASLLYGDDGTPR